MCVSLYISLSRSTFYPRAPSPLFLTSQSKVPPSRNFVHHSASPRSIHICIYIRARSSAVRDPPISSFPFSPRLAAGHSRRSTIVNRRRWQETVLAERFPSRNKGSSSILSIDRRLHSRGALLTLPLTVPRNFFSLGTQPWIGGWSTPAISVRLGGRRTRSGNNGFSRCLVGRSFVRSFVDSVSARSGIVVALVRRLLHSPRFRVCLGGEGGVDLTGLRSHVLLEGKSVLRHFETRPNRPPPYCRRLPSRLAPIRQRRGWLETARTRASRHAFSLRLLPPSSFFFSPGSPSLRRFRCLYLSSTSPRRRVSIPSLALCATRFSAFVFLFRSPLCFCFSLSYFAVRFSPSITCL